MDFDLNFDDLAPKEIPASIGGKKYILRQASEGAAVAYRNAALKAAKMVDGKIVGMDGVANAEPLLVSMCIHPLDHNTGKPRLLPSGDPAPTPLATVMSWLPHVVTKLFATIKEISPGLEEKEDQKTLEKRFEDTCEKLAAIATNGKERQQWQEWMASKCEEKCGAAPLLGGGEGDPDPTNGLPTAGTLTSSSPH